MRTSTRAIQTAPGRRQTTKRHIAQQRTPTRSVNRGQTRTLSRGVSPSRSGSRSPLFGILSIVCFFLFWIFALIAFNSLVVGVQEGDSKRMVASGVLGLFSFLWPIIGLVFGIVAVMKKRSIKVLGIIGLVINGLLLLWVLINMLSH
jgi:hypothetical protein